MSLMSQVYSMTYRKEIAGEAVPNDEKLFSIYELHTDIIVKSSREIKFGHKVNIGSGKSNLILTCEVLEGNPVDSTLYQGKNWLTHTAKFPETAPPTVGMPQKPMLNMHRRKASSISCLTRLWAV
jgi:hypothetical protein